MIRLMAITVCVLSWLTLSPSLAEEPQTEEKNVLQEIFSKNKPTSVAGIPYEKALAILKRHEEDLLKLPGVDAIDMDEQGILVYSDNPSVVPSMIEDLPVRITAPLAQTFPPGKSAELQGPPPPSDCGPSAHWEPEAGRCKRDTLPPDSLISSSPRIPLPPPAGVIILRPDGVQEKANTCPEEFEEKTEHGWRFCLHPGYTDPLPQLWEPPIAGIPFEEARAILKRHQTELMQLPGVTAVGLAAQGIVVHTDNPSLVPSALEGLAIITRPPTRARVNTHSETMQLRPLRGALSIRDQLWPGSKGTLTGVVLAQGKPWLVFPAHGIAECDTNSGCAPGTTTNLNLCSHYSGIKRMVQPPSDSSALVGFVQRWDRIAGGGLPNTDVAAAFMDSNAVEGDGTLLARRTVEGWGTFSGVAASPRLQDTVTLVTSKDG